MQRRRLFSAAGICSAVFTEEGGTCSFKHGVPKDIAIEHERTEVELVLCLFQMTYTNTPAIAHILEQGPLAILPEAQTYLSGGGEHIDVTKPGLHISTLQTVLRKERIISLSQSSQGKVKFIGNE